MGRMRLVALVLGSVLLISGVVFGQAKLGPHVVDSFGRRVGYFAGWSLTDPSRPEAVVFIDGSANLIETARNGFITSDLTIYFAEENCAGEAIVPVDPDHDLIATARFTTDGFFYYPDMPSATEVFIASTSTLHGDGSLGPCDDLADIFLGAPLLNATPPTFTPPFRVVEAFPVSPAPGVATFNDVPTNHPFFQFIEALSASGITGGCQGNPPLYCPDNPVTRGQVAVFLAKALGL
jgi:hypothetical protein